MSGGLVSINARFPSYSVVYLVYVLDFFFSFLAENIITILCRSDTIFLFEKKIKKISLELCRLILLVKCNCVRSSFDLKTPSRCGKVS